MKKEAKSVSTPGESRKDGKGKKTAVASGQTGMKDKATPPEQPVSSGNHGHENHAEATGLPVVDTTKCGSKVGQEKGKRCGEKLR